MIARLALIWVAAAALWVGAPVAWLWVAGQVQGATGSLPAATLVALAGVVASIALAIPVLGALTRGYQDARVARGRDDTGLFPLEVALVCTPCLAAAAALVWLVA